MKSPFSSSPAFKHIQAFLDSSRGQITIGEIPPIRRATLAAEGKKVRVALVCRDNETVADLLQRLDASLGKALAKIPLSTKYCRRSNGAAGPNMHAGVPQWPGPHAYLRTLASAATSRCRSRLPGRVAPGLDHSPREGSWEKAVPDVQHLRAGLVAGALAVFL